MDAAAVKTLIEQGLPGSLVEVHGPDGVHFEARVISANFAGKPTLARHRTVYAALGGRIGGEIHALALRTLTPEEAGLGTRDSGLGAA
ncbi:MAG: BolA/IbaG family iron-sulfur metabolism protein [Rhodanobacteraceae bacterium]